MKNMKTNAKTTDAYSIHRYLEMNNVKVMGVIIRDSEAEIILPDDVDEKTVSQVVENMPPKYVIAPEEDLLDKLKKLPADKLTYIIRRVEAEKI
ncbi:MAG: hypothetical protein QW544_02250 [Candidatus Caldarchaeum sp.]